MKFSKNLVNFDEPTSTYYDKLGMEVQVTPEVAKERGYKTADELLSPEQKAINEARIEKAKQDARYEEILKSGKTTGSNGIEHGYTDLGHEIKKVPGKLIDELSRVKDDYVRDAKEALQGFRGKVASKRDEKGNPISWKDKKPTVWKTKEEELLESHARLKGERAPNNNALFGTLGFRTAEVAAPFAIGAAFLGHKLYKKKKRKKLYEALLEEGYSPDEAERMSKQVNNSEQTNFNVLTGAANTSRGGVKWLLEHGLVAPFKGRKVLTAYNPATGKVEQFREGIVATKDILGKNGQIKTKVGEYIREGGIPGADTLPGKIGMGALGLANVGMTASLITMPASMAADFKRNAEYNKKYAIDPNKHYVIEQDLANNKKVRLIGKLQGYFDRTDANIEADRHAGNGMYQVYAIKGSELARVMPRKFTLEYYPNEY